MYLDFSRADQVVRQGLNDGAYTAACLLVGRSEKVLFRRAYGRIALDDDSLPANEQTLFDLDSLTKPVVTGLLTLRALEAGKLCLNDKLGSFIDAPKDKADITIAQLLTHTSGLPTGLHLWREIADPSFAAKHILDLPLSAAPGEKVQYGCAGYILLGQLLECLYGADLSELASQEIFWPLGMRRAGFRPKDGNTAATEMQDDGRCLQGIVHDGNAQFLGGISGNAGLFASMDDLALMMQMIASRGAMPDGTRFLSKASVRLMLEPQANGRSLLFAFPFKTGFTGDLFPEKTVGHTSFTGCSIAFEPEENVYAIFLTNRICPSRESPAIHRIRRLLHNAVFAAI